MASESISQPIAPRPNPGGRKPIAQVVAAEALISAYVVVDEEIADRRRAGTALVKEARTHFARATALERSRAEIRQAAAEADLWAQTVNARNLGRKLPEAA